MENINIEHFKCFVDTTIPINKLTVLAGTNGNGKSTVIQALLFLRQTIEQCADFGFTYNHWKTDDFRKNNIPLNGPFCLSLGNSDFVLNRNAEQYIRLGIDDSNYEFSVKYSVDNKEPQLWLYAEEFISNLNEIPPLFKHEFYYLNAERIGPRIQQNLQHSNFPHAGWHGESTAQLIDRDKGFWKIADDRRYPGTVTNFIKEQINYWLDFIIPGVKVSANTNPKTLSSQILLENQYTESEPTLATNLGFGISYLLPILATGLVAEKGSYFIVENPEAHLHPSAQSKVGRFLAMVANAGVNVIVETHSDHIINGVQIAIADNTVENNLVVINFFNQTENEIQPELKSISLKKTGELAEWPKGFFDQTQIDFAHLFKLRKS